jgi:hypothetical protein
MRWYVGRHLRKLVAGSIRAYASLACRICGSPMMPSTCHDVGWPDSDPFLDGKFEELLRRIDALRAMLTKRFGMPETLQTEC